MDSEASEAVFNWYNLDGASLERKETFLYDSLKIRILERLAQNVLDTHCCSIFLHLLGHGTRQGQHSHSMSHAFSISIQFSDLSCYLDPVNLRHLDVSDHQRDAFGAALLGQR